MQATMALRYLIGRLDSNAGKNQRMSRCEFHLYLSENVKEGRYLPSDDLSVDDATGRQRDHPRNRLPDDPIGRRATNRNFLYNLGPVFS